MFSGGDCMEAFALSLWASLVPVWAMSRILTLPCRRERLRTLPRTATTTSGALKSQAVQQRR